MEQRGGPVDGSAALGSLLAQVAGGDRSAFEEVYRLTSTKLFGTCLRILPDRLTAEDVLQDVYVSVWQRAGQFDPARGRPMTWLLTLARNRAIDRLRSARPEFGALDETIADARPGPFAHAERASEHNRLADCLDRLAPVDQHYLHAAFFEGSSYPELARRAAAPLGTIKSRIRRALLSLRECIG